MKIEKLLKGSEIAAILNLSRSTTYRMMRQGEIPVVRMGRCVRCRYEDLENFIRANVDYGQLQSCEVDVVDIQETSDNFKCNVKNRK